METTSDSTAVDMLGDPEGLLSRNRGEFPGRGRGSDLTVLGHPRRPPDSPWRRRSRDAWGALVGFGVPSSALVPSRGAHGVARVEALTRRPPEDLAAVPTPARPSLSSAAPVPFRPS